MDDYNLNSLTESRNEWTARLVTILTPFVIEGFKSIYTDAYKLCVENEEEEKYLMTFQNLLSRIPKWNPELIKTEVERIKTTSKCGYIEDLITCVHIIQLKALTCVRVGQHQKKVDLDIPNLETFIHKIYILVARKLYTNIYLFQRDINPLDIQKHNREIELIIKECILCAIRDTIPVEDILRSYLDEVTEENVEVDEEIIPIESNETDDKSNKDEKEKDEKEKDEKEKDEKQKDEKQKDEKQKNKNNIIIEEVMNDDSGSLTLKKNDNIVIDDNNYGVMLDINNLVEPETEEINESVDSNMVSENVSNPILNDIDDKNEVTFSSNVDVNSFETEEDKIEISDSDIKLDDIESLDDPILGGVEVLG